MDRRNFLRSMLGVAAATALPSEIFPFRKIFLPAVPSISAISAVEWELFAIPDLVFRDTPWLARLRGKYPVSSRTFRIPMRETGPSGKFIWMPNEDQARAIAEKQAQGIDVQAAIDALVQV
jgi:TAT (twin-arginine translocation) pathway signal sequence